MQTLLTLESFIQRLRTEIERNGVSIENSGIGHYEYWGAKCFDKGHDFLMYQGSHVMTFPCTWLSEDDLDTIDAGEADFTYRFVDEIENEVLLLDLEVKISTQRQDIVVQIREVD